MRQKSIRVPVHWAMYVTRDLRMRACACGLLCTLTALLGAILPNSGVVS